MVTGPRVEGHLEVALQELHVRVRFVDIELDVLSIQECAGYVEICRPWIGACCAHAIFN